MDRQYFSNFFSTLRERRGLVQALATLISNINLPNFFKGTIHMGASKKVCVPGLNCYSCPGAAGSCPIGAFQAVVGSSKFSFSYYITGLLILFGVLFGRLICGFLCPFGWFQDLLHRIPSKKLSTKKLGFLKYLKYLILVFAVWLLGVFLADDMGISSPFFCKYICPQGILEAGIPLSLGSPAIRSNLGVLFLSKGFILIAVILLSVFFYRPFCKWVCPLGAFYSLLNKVSFYKYHFNSDACINCGKCAGACKMDVDIRSCQDALECIRCGECIKACPTGAISTSLSLSRAKPIAEPRSMVEN